jgi:hypothetical protein
MKHYTMNMDGDRHVCAMCLRTKHSQHQRLAELIFHAALLIFITFRFQNFCCFNCSFITFTANLHWTLKQVILDGADSGLGSSVGIVTSYRLESPGIASQWGWEFPHTSRPAMGPTQPPVQWVPGLSWEYKAVRGWCWPLTLSSSEV